MKEFSYFSVRNYVLGRLYVATVRHQNNVAGVYNFCEISFIHSFIISIFKVTTRTQERSREEFLDEVTGVRDDGALSVASSIIKTSNVSLPVTS